MARAETEGAREPNGADVRFRPVTSSFQGQMRIDGVTTFN